MGHKEKAMLLFEKIKKWIQCPQPRPLECSCSDFSNSCSAFSRRLLSDSLISKIDCNACRRRTCNDARISLVP
jgi:hypothetical protein